MEALINPSYQPPVEDKIIEEKIIQIKKDLGVNLENQLSIDELAEHVRFVPEIRWEIAVYITKNLQTIRIWEIQTENNKISYLYSINYEIRNPKNKIKNLGSFLLQKAIEKIQSNKIYLTPLDDVIEFYKKTLERFKKNWIIKDYQIKEWEIEIIKC